MADTYKILIIRLSAIGDTIHTLPLAYALRQKYPDAQIDWLVEDKAAQFVENNPLIDNVIVVPKKAWKKGGILKYFDGFNKIVAKLQKQHYDIVIDAQQLLKSALFMRFSGGERLITLSGGREFSGKLANEVIPASHSLLDKDYHVVYRNLEIAKYLGCETEEPVFVLPESSEKVKKYIKGLCKDFDPKKPVLVLAPATTWATKHWTNKGWAEIIKAFEDTANIVITGTDADKELVEDILLYGNFKGVHDFTGKTDLAQLAELYRKADVVVAPDSGSAQIAWGCQKPYVVTVFTSTSNKRTAPFGEKAVSFAPKIDCYPCHKKNCRNKNFEICKKSIDYCEIITFLQKLFK